jgi:hypothetical protein
MHGGLLRQAHLLAGVDSHKPSQANLRRSLSAAYYCLFHRLIADSAAHLVGGQRSRAALRHALSRSFVHSQMMNTCKLVISGKPLSATAGLVPSAELQDVAQLFVELQERRHEADYDLGAVFTRSGVRTLLARLDRVLVTWDQIRKTDEAAWFLTALLVGPKLLGY